MGDPATGTPYATNKIAWHPEALQRMRDHEHPPAPILVQFMPELRCNQHCAFCAYGHRVATDGPAERGWKNMALMAEAGMPRIKALECIDSFDAIGVKAIEITGGGEPLIWPHIDDLFERLKTSRMEVGLVTNGTALTIERAFRFSETKWKWARVSIDAGTPEQYVATRRVPKGHWKKAWDAVAAFACYRRHADQKVGVGYVVDRSNYNGIYDGARLAKKFNADNIRISFAFTPLGPNRLHYPRVAIAREQALAAVRAFDDEGFQVVNLLDERIGNTKSTFQDYSLCGEKEVTCVVAADLNVYHCCTLAFSELGRIGSIKEQSFAELWSADGTKRLFRDHNPRASCSFQCLYERRNLATIRYLRSPALAELVAGEPEPLHKNFI